MQDSRDLVNETVVLSPITLHCSLLELKNLKTYSRSMAHNFYFDFSDFVHSKIEKHCSKTSNCQKAKSTGIIWELIRTTDS